MSQQRIANAFSVSLLLSFHVTEVCCFASSRHHAPQPKVNLESSIVDVEVDRRTVVTGISTVATAFLVSGPTGVTAANNVIPEWTLEGGVKFPTLALNTVGLSAEDTERALGLAV